jgi:geranylgeranylglycerol-phosphate geranylgeranyltransferase
MRWHSSFLAVMAGWIGIAYQKPGVNDIPLILIILAILFTGWGVNQVINDCLGQDEDRLNAPYRPILTGKLNIKFAYWLNLVFFISGLMITLRLNTCAVPLYILVFTLNLIYERAKRIPSFGNIIFGLLISPCVYYAYLCLNNRGFIETLTNQELLIAVFLVTVMNAVLCFISDFKDYAGDMKSGIRTLVVMLTPQKAQYLTPIFVGLPFAFLYYFIDSHLLPGPNLYFWIAFLLALSCLAYSCLVILKKNAEDYFRHAMKWGITGTIIFESAIACIFSPLISFWILLATLPCLIILLYLDKKF